MPDRIIRADQYQQEDDPAPQIAARRESAIKRAIVAGLISLGVAVKAVSLANITNVTILIASIRSNPVSDALLSAYKEVNDTFTQAAELETESKLGRLVVYDPVVAAADRATAQNFFISQIQDQAEMVARQALGDSLRLGLSSEEIANVLENVISLSPRQAKAVINYRNALENLDIGALNRELRDRRFDRTLINAVENRRALTPEQVDTMVERYAARSLQFRASMIARTESMNAATGGIRDAYVQAVKSGRLFASEVTRNWQLVLDERLCPVCASVPLLNPNGVGVLEPYLTIHGPVMAPGIHPNCRCSEKYRANLSRVASSPFAQAA